MQVDKQNTPTDLEVFVTRLKSINEKEQSRIPDPIAEPKAEFLVNRRTAISYEIEEGDYIQVIDIYGRQCSDFLAFDRSKLDKGIEMELDSLAIAALEHANRLNESALSRIHLGSFFVLRTDCYKHSCKSNH